jgi:hypothetical protein
MKDFNTQRTGIDAFGSPQVADYGKHKIERNWD